MPTPSPEGADGWSISVASEGVAIEHITTDNTAAVPFPRGFRRDGFEKSEVTTLAGGECPDGLQGAVSTVVLSFRSRITLPGNDNTQVIARLTLSGNYAEQPGCRDARVFYTNGCRGSGEPVTNSVTWMGNALHPSRGSCGFRVCSGTSPPCPDDLESGVQLIIQSQNIRHVPGDPFATGAPPGLAPTPDRFLPAQISAAPGSTTVYAGIVSQFDDPFGVEAYGWSLAVSVRGELRLTEATTRGTAGANVPVGLVCGGFEHTELVNPDVLDARGEPQGQGAVSAIVLSFSKPSYLADSSTATVLSLTIEGDEGETGSILWVNGLRGSGQPQQNRAIVAGEAHAFHCCQEAEIRFQATGDFVRCDPNGDGKSDLADAVWIVSELFRGGQASACPTAADCDGGGSEDVTDAVYAVHYQFRGGPPPPPPFPSCGGRELLATPEDCPLGSAPCL